MVYCQVCNKMITCIKKSQIVQHINTTLHSIKRKTDNKKQLFELEANSKNPNIFNEDFCESLIQYFTVGFKNIARKFYNKLS